MKNLFIVDDEKSICNALMFNFENEYNINIANNMMEFNNILLNNIPDIVLLDLKFGTANGLELLEQINAIYPDAVVIIMTAYGTIDTSIEAIKKGAYDYILKPLEPDMIKKLVNDASLYQENKKMKTIKLDIINKNYNIIGCSPKMQKIYSQIDRVKDVNVNVLICGEGGTGKDLIARAIHYEGARKENPFIVVNCAAIPQNLIESELFGYEKGAFTGAEKDKKGAFELADKGSIFLDEIGEMDLYCQAKILRVIQNKEVVPVGSGVAKKVDVRIIAATNKDLSKEVKNSNFRMDLFYRLNVFPIKIAALNERTEDIPLLVDNFINMANELYGTNIQGITNEALNALKERKYAGNVRELENIIFRACIMSDNEYISIDCLQYEDSGNVNVSVKDHVSIKIGSSLEYTERELILSTLNYVNGNKAKAAKLLGISERSIHYKVKNYLGEN